MAVESSGGTRFVGRAGRAGLSQFNVARPLAEGTLVSLEPYRALATHRSRARSKE